MTRTKDLWIPEDLQIISTVYTILQPELQALWEELQDWVIEPTQFQAPDIYTFARECIICRPFLKHMPWSQLELVDNDKSLKAKGTRYSVEDQSEPPIPLTAPLYSNDEAFLTTSKGRWHLLGLIYVIGEPQGVPSGEVNMGIAVRQVSGRDSFASQAAQATLNYVLGDLGYHRIQVAIQDGAHKYHALKLFTGLGFRQEGTKRGSFYAAQRRGLPGGWRDVTYLALLDTDWALERGVSHSDSVMESDAVRKLWQRTVWDEMLARHGKEREDLIRMEEQEARKIRRSSSVETIRLNDGDSDQGTSDDDDDEGIRYSDIKAGKRKAESKQADIFQSDGIRTPGPFTTTNFHPWSLSELVPDSDSVWSHLLTETTYQTKRNDDVNFSNGLDGQSHIESIPSTLRPPSSSPPSEMHTISSLPSSPSSSVMPSIPSSSASYSATESTGVKCENEGTSFYSFRKNIYQFPLMGHSLNDSQWSLRSRDTMSVTSSESWSDVADERSSIHSSEWNIIDTHETEAI